MNQKEMETQNGTKRGNTGPATHPAFSPLTEKQKNIT